MLDDPWSWYRGASQKFKGKKRKNNHVIGGIVVGLKAGFDMEYETYVLSCPWLDIHGKNFFFVFSTVLVAIPYINRILNKVPV